MSIHILDRTDKLELIEKINGVTGEEFEAVQTPCYTTGWYDTVGNFHTEANRAFKILNVFPGEKYNMETTISSTIIPYLLFRDENNAVISYDMLGSNGTPQVVTVDFEIPDGCTSVIVHSGLGNYPPCIRRYVTKPYQSVRYDETITISVGRNLMEGATPAFEAAHWSGDNSTGYTHAAGNVSPLQYYSEYIEEGSVYLCEFDTSYTADEFVTVGIGTQYRIPVYNGTSHIAVPLLAKGNRSLWFIPENGVEFTISNVSLRKINDNDELRAIEVYNTLTANHDRNYGFWNVLIGESTAENAVGSTRTVAIGFHALRDLQGGHRNVALGTFAMSQMTGGEKNISIGADSMLGVKQAKNCVAMGFAAMNHGLACEDNVAIGALSLYGDANKDTSKRNVAVGRSAGRGTTGQDNVFIGYQAGYRNRENTGNVCIGSNAFGAATGSHNTCVGEGASHSEGVSNGIAFGYGTTATKSNQLVIGNASITEVVIAGKIITFNEDGTVTWRNA